MATIVSRKTRKGAFYQVKVRLKGFPTQCATFARKTDVARWASGDRDAPARGQAFSQ